MPTTRLAEVVPVVQVWCVAAETRLALAVPVVSAVPLVWAVVALQATE